MYGFNLKTLIFILGDLSSFTRFSDNLNNNLEVKVTKILTLRFLIDLEKKNKKKTCVTSFSSYCVHKVGCPWCPAPTQPAEWGQFIKIKILKKLSLLKKKEGSSCWAPIYLPAAHNLLNFHRKILGQDIRCPPYQTPVDTEYGHYNRSRIKESSVCWRHSSKRKTYKYLFLGCLCLLDSV